MRIGSNSHRLALLAAVAMFTLPLTGCGTNRHRDSSDDNGPLRTSGSSSAADINGIPRAAWSVANGSGDLDWRADDDGTVYVADTNRNDLVVQHRIQRGERIQVLPGDNRIKIDDNTISRADLTSNHTHRIFMVRDHEDRNSNGNGNDRYRDRDHDGDNDNRR